MTAGERLRQLKQLRESRNGDLRLTTAPAVSASHVAAAAANSAVSSPSPTFSPSRWVPTPHVAVYMEEPQGNMWKLIADQKNKEYTVRKNLERETREANIKDQCEVLRQQMADRQNRAAARKEEALVFRSQIDLDKMKWDGELAAAAKERRNRAERVVRELNDQQADRQRRKEENARMLEMENQLLAKQIEGFRLEAEQQAARERREKELVKEDLDRANQAQLDELKRRKEAEIRYNLQLDEEQRQKEATDAARKAKQLADLRLKQMKQDSMSSHMKAVADDKERAEEARARAEYERIEAAKIEKEITDRKRKKESLEKVLRLQALQIREKQLRADDECRRKQLENEEVETLLRAADEANRSEKRMRHDNSLKQHRSITAQINNNTKKQWLVMSEEEQRINRKALERALGTRSMTPGTRMSLSPF